MAAMTITQLPDQAAREARIRKMCQDHAWRFHAVTPGSEYRYVIEAYVPGASWADWDYAYAYIAATPQLFTTMPRLQPREIAERDRANSDRLYAESRAAYDAGDYPLALAMIDDADWWAPVLNGDRIREVIRAAMGGA